LDFKKGKEMKTKKIIALFFAIVMVFAFAACGGGADSDSSPADSSADVATESEAAPPAAEVVTLALDNASALQSAQKDVLNIGIPADVSNFNPWSFSGAGANQALMSLYQPLLHHDNGEYFNAIAKSDFEMAPDGTSCKFEIFDNIYDSAGNHLTIDDVIFSFTKVGEVRPQYAKLIPNIEKIDEYTCIFHFSHALLLTDFDSFVRIFVVTEKAYSESPDEMATTPVGTGHYKMTSYTSGYSSTYERVEDYWQKDMNAICTRDLANVKTLNFYVISESAQRTMALENGTIDFCMTVTDEDLKKFDGENGKQVAAIESNETMTLFNNCDTSSVCNDLNLRLAISYAVSGDAVLQGVYNGDGVVCHEFTPPYASGYNPKWDTEDNYYKYDPAKAAEYLGKSKYNGETLTLICRSTESSKTASEIVQNFLTQIGIKAAIESYEATVFEQYIQDPGKWDIMVTETQYNTYYIEGVFGSYDVTRYASGGGMNFVFDTKLQDLLTLCMEQTTYTPENVDLLHNHIIENCYVKGLAAGVDEFVVSDDVTGICLNFRGFILPGACTFS
jgi:ABC-type transport system substrate-binding protein